MLDGQAIQQRRTAYALCIADAGECLRRARVHGRKAELQRLEERLWLLIWARHVLCSYKLNGETCEAQWCPTDEDALCAMRLADPGCVICACESPYADTTPPDICDPTGVPIDFACDLLQVAFGYPADENGDPIQSYLALVTSDDTGVYNDPSFMTAFTGLPFVVGDIIRFASAPGSYGFGPFNVTEVVAAKPPIIKVVRGNNDYNNPLPPDEHWPEDLSWAAGIYTLTTSGTYLPQYLAYTVQPSPDHTSVTVYTTDTAGGLLSAGSARVEYTEDGTTWEDLGMHTDQVLSSGVVFSVTPLSTQMRVTPYYLGQCQGPAVLYPLNPLPVDLFLPGTDPQSYYGAAGPQLGILWRSYKGAQFSEIGMGGNRLNRAAILTGNAAAGELNPFNPPVQWKFGGTQHRSSAPQFNLVAFGNMSQLGRLSFLSGSSAYPWLVDTRLGLRDDREYIVAGNTVISPPGYGLGNGVVVGCSQIEYRALVAVYPRGLTVSTDFMSSPPPGYPGGVVPVSVPGAVKIHSCLLFGIDSFVIFGEDGKVWKTIDGGTTWTSVSPWGPIVLDMDSIAMDSTTAFVVIRSGPSFLWKKTVDAGVTWTDALPTSPPANINMLRFHACDRDHIVIGKYYSNDGGDTWQVMNTPNGVSPVRSLVLAPDIIMLALDQLWISMDGGATFRLYTVQPTADMLPYGKTTFDTLSGGIYTP